MAHAASRIRPPAVAGRFYAADERRCAADAARYCVPVASLQQLPPTLYGALVPHAGWICSGRVAGMTWATLARRTAAKTIVLTGSVHTMAVFNPTLDSADAWATPLGPLAVDTDLRDALAQLPGAAVQTLDMAHEYEHSLEVQAPMIRAAFGDETRIVPCLIPPAADAVQWGEAIGKLLVNWHAPVVMVVSSDLTHYGPNYRFTPHGVGEAGVTWAHDTNDRRVLDMMLAMNEADIVHETHQHQNACGGGAIAATLAACRALGASHGYLLEHTHSVRELAPLGHSDGLNSVGYAGIVFG
ncbi:MAG: AmmeMemoRadiSam system protein B [Planctomycetes bacterium]|nr:AmmeMemoRadiSam system protein B [Planctomycetota bacterium]